VAEVVSLNVYEEAEKLDTEIAIRQALLKTGVSNRAKRARFMLYLYYWQDWTLEEIGQEFDVSKQRTWEIIGSTLDKLRQILDR